jgi:hypothetical protein
MERIGEWTNEWCSADKMTARCVRNRTVDGVRRSVQRTALASLSLLAWAIGCFGGDETPKDRFKALFTSPPIIERMIVTERLPEDPLHAVPLDTGLADSTNVVTTNCAGRATPCSCGLLASHQTRRIT